MEAKMSGPRMQWTARFGRDDSDSAYYLLRMDVVGVEAPSVPDSSDELPARK